jgi:hypothetical protein
MAADPKLLSLSRYDDAIGAEAFVHMIFYDDAGRIAEAGSKPWTAAFFPAPTERSMESPT